ncbi:dimethyladenosine transferase 2, mitochondrial [Ctenodactylus gundi]
MVFPPRLMWSVLAGAGRFCFLRSGVVTCRNLPAFARRGLSDFYPQLLPCEDFGEPSGCGQVYRVEPRNVVTCQKLAKTLTEILQGGQKECPQLFLECNPGPGILTQALLGTGAKVVALECDKTFIPHLESLGENLNGNLDVVHCDFFKMDPFNYDKVKPPVMLARELFQSLGIDALCWSAGIPLKVIGILPLRTERRALWKLLYDLYACSSIYRYGRVELNMFISEKEYQKLMAGPTDPDSYHTLSVLWQVACDIKLLHKKSLKAVKQNLCFIQMTPRQNLFTDHLTPISFDIFFHLVKQCFGKRSATVIHHLHSLTPIDPVSVMKKTKFKNKNIKVLDLYPEDFKHLFETIECSSDSTYKWLYDGFPEDADF